MKSGSLPSGQQCLQEGMKGASVGAGGVPYLHLGALTQGLLACKNLSGIRLGYVHFSECRLYFNTKF